MFPLLFPSQILFILLDSNLKSNERVVSFFKLKKSQLPALALFHAPDEEQDVLTLDEVSVERVQDFCNRFLQRMQKVKGDSCTVYRKQGSGRTMLFLTRLLKKITSVPWTPHPCHLLFHFHLHLNIRKALDLEQSRDGCLCRTCFFIDLCLLVYSKKTSLTSATVWRSRWSIYFLGTAAGETVKGAFGHWGWRWWMAAHKRGSEREWHG